MSECLGGWCSKSLNHLTSTHLPADRRPRCGGGCGDRDHSTPSTHVHRHYHHAHTPSHTFTHTHSHTRADWRPRRGRGCSCSNRRLNTDPSQASTLTPLCYGMRHTHLLTHTYTHTYKQLKRSLTGCKIDHHTHRLVSETRRRLKLQQSLQTSTRGLPLHSQTRRG